jgi:ABC-type multidrug transport system permease subunit
MAAILAMPLMNQMQPHWESLTSLYAARERPSKMYHWSAFVFSNVITEIPFNLVAGTLFFLPWYFAVGFWHGYSGTDQAKRGIYQWLMIMAFEMWWSTFGQVMSALSPNAQTATTFSTLFASFVITFNGVLQPLRQLTSFWHWMYYLSPFTWLISGLMSNSVSGTKIVCSSTEINVFNPPKGQKCLEYAGTFIQNAGAIYNPNATMDCQYCRYSVADQYLASVNMSYADRWRNLGFLFAYIIFNVTMIFVAFWLTKVVRLNLSKWTTKFGKKKQANTRPTDVEEVKRDSSIEADTT